MSSLVNSIKYLEKKAEEILSNSFYKVSISLFLKSDRNIIGKKIPTAFRNRISNKVDKI